MLLNKEGVFLWLLLDLIVGIKFDETKICILSTFNYITVLYLTESLRIQ